MISSKFKISSTRLAVIGLGYVGLPLAIEFGKHLPVIGFDVSQNRIEELKAGQDSTKEVENCDFVQANLLEFTTDQKALSNCNFFIVTVPTPVDQTNRPDLTALQAASKLVGSLIKEGGIVVFESTVFPGCTEEICVPIIEENSGLWFHKDFFCGYSPERINPGDKTHRLTDIVKITSGSTELAASFIDEVYNLIIRAGTHSTSSIKVAEAAKVIENTQRDLNIALINELSLIFRKLEIDTQEVLQAAGTKWNFLPFTPGLVGGHCISVDPYYLTHKAQELGYNPEVILSGRRVNDSMGHYVAGNLIKEMCKKGINPCEAKVLILGLSFKENCPDVRNTKVVDIIDTLASYGMTIDVFDPWVSPEDAFREYEITLLKKPERDKYDAAIIAVNHNIFIEKGVKTIKQYCKKNSVLFDVKWAFKKQEVDLRL